jgi:hypothetical protein
VKRIFIRRFDSKEVIDGFLDSFRAEAPSVTRKLDCLHWAMVVNSAAMLERPVARRIVGIKRDGNH